MAENMPPMMEDEARAELDSREIRYPDVEVDLVGEDGNAFAILGRVQKALRRAGVTEAEVKAYMAEATGGDYGHLLCTTMRWVTAN